jgi:hypothetical protein
MFVCDTFSFVYNMFFELKINGPARVSSKKEIKMIGGSLMLIKIDAEGFLHYFDLH